jgi:hypothetical protein
MMKMMKMKKIALSSRTYPQEKSHGHPMASFLIPPSSFRHEVGASKPPFLGIKLDVGHLTAVLSTEKPLEINIQHYLVFGSGLPNDRLRFEMIQLEPTPM